jgi:hypothetical protein
VLKDGDYSIQVSTLKRAVFVKYCSTYITSELYSAFLVK